MSVLSECRFYGIIDLGYVQESDITHVAEQLIEGCVDMIQLRGKGKSLDELTGYAARLHEITARSSTPLIVNDHAEIASRVPVEGVHVGQDDDSIEVARRKAGRIVLIGKSTHSLDQALAAQHEGADYIGFGPIFATPTKPDYAPIGLADIKRVHAGVNAERPMTKELQYPNAKASLSFRAESSNLWMLSSRDVSTSLDMTVSTGFLIFHSCLVRHSLATP